MVKEVNFISLSESNNNSISDIAVPQDIPHILELLTINHNIKRRDDGNKSWEIKNIQFDEEETVLSEERVDVLGNLRDRGLFHVIDKVLSRLSARSLLSIRLANSEYLKVVETSKLARRKVRKELGWLGETGPRQDVVTDIRDRMVCSLAADKDTVAYGLLGSDSIIKLHSRTGGFNKVLVQETSFPATISCIALAPGLVITCAYQVHHTQFGPQYVVTIWDRETGSVMSTFRPHEDIIRGVVMVTDKFLVTASNDQTLAVTDLSQPSRPKNVAYLRGHLGSISGMDTDHRDRLVSICSGQELRVWSLNKTRCLMTMTTPGLCLRVKIWDKYVAAGGQDKIWIWNLTRGEVVRYLGIRNNGILNVLGGMTGGHIVAGDHLGVLSVWSMESLLEGEGDGVVYPHRSLNVEGGPGHEFLSGLVVEENSVVTAGWGGRVIVWNFL